MSASSKGLTAISLLDSENHRAGIDAAKFSLLRNANFATPLEVWSCLRRACDPRWSNMFAYLLDEVSSLPIGHAQGKKTQKYSIEGRKVSSDQEIITLV